VCDNKIKPKLINPVWALPPSLFISAMLYIFIYRASFLSSLGSAAQLVSRAIKQSQEK